MHPGLVIIHVLATVIRVIVSGKLKMIPMGGKLWLNKSNNNRPSFDTLKTGDCKPVRTVREGCGSTEPEVCSFVLGTYPQRGSAPPPPPPPPAPGWSNIPLVVVLKPQSDLWSVHDTLIPNTYTSFCSISFCFYGMQ